MNLKNNNVINDIKKFSLTVLTTLKMGTERIFNNYSQWPLRTKKYFKYSLFILFIFLLIVSMLTDSNDKEVHSMLEIGCNEVNLLEKEDKILINMWIDGYLGGINYNKVISNKGHFEFLNYCKSNPDKKIRDAIEERDFIKDDIGFDLDRIKLSQMNDEAIYFIDGFLTQISENEDSSVEWLDSLTDLAHDYLQRNPDASIGEFIDYITNTEEHN